MAIEAYDQTTIEQNAGKIEPLSLLYGASIGIIISAFQNLLHYITNNSADVSYLGAFTSNLLIGVGLAIATYATVEYIKSYQRKALLKIPSSKAHNL